MSEPTDRDQIEIHNTQELDQAEEDEVVEYLQRKELLEEIEKMNNPLWPDVQPAKPDAMWALIDQFIKGLAEQAERMRNVGKP